MTHCGICGRKVRSHTGICGVCETSIFQVREFLRHYLDEEVQPEWLSNAIKELSWLLLEYPKTAAFFNSAEEVLHVFLLGGEEKIHIEEFTEFNYTHHPRNTVIDILKRAEIIKVDGDYLLPGKLTTRLLNTKWAGFALSDGDFEKGVIEFRGILTMAITWSLLQEERFIPKRVMSILAVFSLLILRGSDSKVVDDLTFRTAMSGLTQRQQNRIRSYMAGFKDGKTKIINDINDDGDLILKPEIVEYIVRTRERLREYERDSRQRV